MKKSILLLAISMVFSVSINAQYFDESKGCFVVNGECVPNTVLSAMPFLRIVPDARSGGLGDVGLALSPTSNAMHFNASNLAFVENDFAISTTFTPWLRNLGLSDVFLGYISGYKNVDDLQSIGASLRYFSLGEINFTDVDGNPAGTGRPNEIEVAAAYARKLGDNFSAGLTAKYIYSNLANGQRVGEFIIAPANAFAVDLSFTYDRELDLTTYGSNLRIGAALTNLGSKVTYTQNLLRDFLPGNFGIGAALDLEFDEYNMMTFGVDFNKLMVPTPQAQLILNEETGTTEANPDWDCCPENGIADYREQALFSGLINSWGDAPGGFSEELSEWNIGVALEYWYARQFAVRAGYFYENPLKGDRQFLTFGVGLKASIIGVDLSYLAPTSNQNNPLDNTLRFTISLDVE